MVTRPSKLSQRIVAFALLSALPLACSDSHVNVASTGSGTGGANGGTGANGPGSGGSMGAFTTGTMTGTTSTSTGVIAPPTDIAECQGHVYACGNLIDDDGDGLIDSQDPDCLGPCDDTEDSLFGGIPGQAGPPCKVDCYFDQDSGSGNDDCHWSHVCDPNEVDPTYYPEPDNGASCSYAGPDQVIPPTGKTCSELNAMQSQACHDYCGPLTPNGCDCFGCCELPASTGHFIWLGSEGADGNTVCTLDKIDDPTVCHPCVPVADCLNPCDPCEICVGKPNPDPGCDPTSGAGGGGSGQCDTGVQPCGLPDQPACPQGYFCTTGCCVEVPS